MTDRRTKLTRGRPSQDDGGATEADRADQNLLTVQEAAERARLSRWTLYHWISEGKLTLARGLRPLGSRRMIEWSVFKAAVDRGEFDNYGYLRESIPLQGVHCKEIQNDQKNNP